MKMGKGSREKPGSRRGLGVRFLVVLFLVHDLRDVALLQTKLVLGELTDVEVLALDVLPLLQQRPHHDGARGACWVHQCTNV